MKLTESYLKKIIKEEMVNEASFLDKLKGRLAPLSGRSLAGEDYMQRTIQGVESDVEEYRSKESEKKSQQQKDRHEKMIDLKISLIIDNKKTDEATKKYNELLDYIRENNIYNTYINYINDKVGPYLLVNVQRGTPQPSVSKDLKTANINEPGMRGDALTKGRVKENKQGVNNTMQLTTERLKQIIKEELEAIVNEMGEETETEQVSEVDAEIASLEQQLAEAKAKAAKGKKAAMKSKMPAKRKDGGMKKVGSEQSFSSAKSAMKPMKKGH